MLLIEDDEDIRLILRDILQEAGYRVAEAATIGEAESYLRAGSTPPSVVVLDYRFPSGRAGAMLRAVAENTALARHCYLLMPDVRISYYPEAEQQLIAATCAGVISKPFTIEDAIAIVEHAASLPTVRVSLRGR